MHVRANFSGLVSGTEVSKAEYPKKATKADFRGD